MLSTRGVVVAGLAVVVLGAGGSAEEPRRIALEYAPAAVGNPMKGLVPYAGQGRSFPHSLEFDYVGLDELVTGYDAIEWGPIEDRLEAIAGRGHQAVFRIFIEYPKRNRGIPKFLLEDGLATQTYLADEDDPTSLVTTPDYEDERLRRVLRSFIAAFGERYDGDPRLGFLTAGLLGHWGEWHTYPQSDLFASKEVQQEVLDAFEAAFTTTPVLLRYPAGENDRRMASNAHRGLGYHDDSFAWATLETGRREDFWYFIPLLKAAGPEALEKWKTHPIGGEIRPEAWGKVFDEDPGDPQIQDFRQCVEETHASWLLDTGMTRRNIPESRRARAEDAVRRMGYEFHVPAVEIGAAEDGGRSASVSVSVEVENRGVAPFYVDWAVEFGLIPEGDGEVAVISCEATLLGLLPGAPARRWSVRIAEESLSPGPVTLALRVRNPLDGGPPIRFANTTQDQDRDGWLSLGRIGEE